MNVTDQRHNAARCGWGLRGLRALTDASIIVIVDVLSFSTSVDVALGQGAMILPYRWKDARAQAYADTNHARLAAPRDAAGFSLAPSSLVAAPAGLRLVLPSPNGATLSVEARATGATVLTGCLRNAAAVAHAAATLAEGSIAVIAAGERWPDGTLRPALEDLLGAGAILHHLADRSPEADAAVAAFVHAAPTLPAQLHKCSSGRELIARGFPKDVELAATLNVSAVVPCLRENAYRPLDAQP